MLRNWFLALCAFALLVNSHALANDHTLPDDLDTWVQVTTEKCGDYTLTQYYRPLTGFEHWINTLARESAPVFLFDRQVLFNGEQHIRKVYAHRPSDGWSSIFDLDDGQRDQWIRERLIMILRQDTLVAYRCWNAFVSANPPIQ